MIFLNDIINHLLNYIPTIISFKSNNAQFVDVNLIEKNQMTFEKNTLYVGYNSSLSQIKSLIKDTSFILIEDITINYEDIVCDNTTIIELSQQTDLFELFNTIKKLFNKKQIFLNSSAKLLDDLIYCKGIDAIVETASKILNNPVILLDFSYKVLSYSKLFPIVDTLWLENIERGYCSYEYISSVLTLKDFKYAPPEDTPFIVKCSSDDNRRMVIRILIDGKCFGYFITIESNNSFDNIEKETYKLIGKVISKEIKFSKNATCQYSKMSDSVFVDLLENTLNNKFTFLERVKGTLFDKNSNYLLFSFDLSKYNHTNNKSERLKHFIETILPLIHSIYYKEKILALVDLKNKNQLSPQIFQKLEEFLKENSIIIGASTLFNSCYNLASSYEQANKSLYFAKMFKENKYIYYYEDYKFYHLLSSVDNSENLNNFCYSTTLQIADYDKKNNTQYLNTLFEYLNCDKSITKASNNLFVHKNTVTYRLNKIKDLFNVDINNTFEIFQLYYSYLMLRYENKIQKKCKETMI